VWGNDVNLPNELEEIKIKFIAKSISYEEAKKQAKPILENYNLKAKEIAKKYKKKPKLLSFVGLFR